jgi:HPt (histidine-containing phosphotransfer) domain-containing protein
MSETTVLDEVDVIDVEALKRRCLGNLDLVQRVLKKFATQLKSDLAELERAARTGDAETFALVAHRVKGMSANVEARELNRQAAAAEQCALARVVSELPQCLERMQQEHARVAEVLPGLEIRA